MDLVRQGVKEFSNWKRCWERGRLARGNWSGRDARTPRERGLHLAGKPAGQRTADIAVDDRVVPRIFGDSLQDSGDGLTKLMPQAGSAFLIPIKRFAYVRLGFGPNEQWPAHFVREEIRARTSSQGEPAWGSRWKASKRSSIKRRSSSVISRASGTAMMLFQMSSTKCHEVKNRLSIGVVVNIYGL